MMRGVSETEPHILVVDDHRDIRELLARYLAKMVCSQRTNSA
jgi:CheY-like chemotaxis protein